MTGSLDDIRKELSGGEPTKCEKVSYETKLAARKALLNHWVKGKKMGSIYICETCQTFHLTRQKPGNKNFRFL